MSKYRKPVKSLESNCLKFLTDHFENVAFKVAADKVRRDNKTPPSSPEDEIVLDQILATRQYLKSTLHSLLREVLIEKLSTLLEGLFFHYDYCDEISLAKYYLGSSLILPELRCLCFHSFALNGIFIDCLRKSKKIEKRTFFIVRKNAALPTTLHIGSYSLNREFRPKTSLFQKSIGSFHNKVEKSVKQLSNGDRICLGCLQKHTKWQNFYF